MMTHDVQSAWPKVGMWYRDTLERRFEVVSLDEESALIQVRYEDGDSGELSLADWRHAMLEHKGVPGDYLTSPDQGDER